MLGTGLDLYDNYKRTFVIGKSKTAIEFIETDEDFDEISFYLENNNA
jgi:hypothetical protein